MKNILAASCLLFTSLTFGQSNDTMCADTRAPFVDAYGDLTADTPGLQELRDDALASSRPELAAAAILFSPGDVQRQTRTEALKAWYHAPIVLSVAIGTCHNRNCESQIANHWLKGDPKALEPHLWMAHLAALDEDWEDAAGWIELAQGSVGPIPDEVLHTAIAINGFNILRPDDPATLDGATVALSESTQPGLPVLAPRVCTVSDVTISDEACISLAQRYQASNTFRGHRSANSILNALVARRASLPDDVQPLDLDATMASFPPPDEAELAVFCQPGGMLTYIRTYVQDGELAAMNWVRSNAAE